MGTKLSSHDYTKIRSEGLTTVEYKELFENITDQDIINDVEGTIDILERTGLKINRYIEGLPEELWSYMNCKKVWSMMRSSDILKNIKFSKYLLEQTGYKITEYIE